MEIEEFIAKFRSRKKNYDAAGLIDDLDIYEWVEEALHPFGTNIAELNETVLEVRKGKVKLPSSFFSLYLAYKCDRKGYHVPKKEQEAVVQEALMWVERTERKREWHSCDPCCVEESEKIIVEKKYIKDNNVEFYYHNPVLLRLGKSMSRKRCFDAQRSMYDNHSPYEIIINKQTLLTNFEEGDIYMQYYASPTDDEGRPYIPDTELGHLAKYVDAYVNLQFYTQLLENGDDTNIITLFKYYIGQESILQVKASTELKMRNFSPESFRKLKQYNRSKMRDYELMCINM